MKYSVVIAAKNEAGYIQGAIKSAEGVDEIIVINDESTDQTAEIAKTLGAKVYRRKLDGFATQKNFGIDKAANDWILILDADERLTQGLADEIKALTPSSEIAGYQMAFRNFVGSKWLRHGGLYPDYHIRLFDRTKARYGEREIHEQLKYDGEVVTLSNDIIHLTYRDFREYSSKVKKYAILETEWDKTKPSLIMIVKTFYRKYIKDLGILDGYAGFRSALLLSRYQLIKRRALS